MSTGCEGRGGRGERGERALAGALSVNVHTNHVLL